MYIYKSFFFLFVLLFIVPSFVFADSYDGPYCFENPRNYVGVPDDASNIRGTCKEVEIKTVVSLDPALKKDYFLGTHAPIDYGCFRMVCEGTTTYSEYLFLTSSSTLEEQTWGVEESPAQYALFKKAYFAPLLTKMFEESGISFSENTVSNIKINIFKKSEFDEIKKIEKTDSDISIIIPENLKMDSLNIQKDADLSEQYTIFSLKNQEYGKYIYAPKGTLVESQYADFEKAGSILKNEDLQINIEGGWRNPRGVVPVTSPLKSVTNYWLYTKKAGKLVLSWQKSEYVLDNGQVKVVTGADKNMNAAFLFSNSFQGSFSKSIKSTSSATTTSVSVPVEQRKGFFVRLFDLILSWFR